MKGITIQAALQKMLLAFVMLMVAGISLAATEAVTYYVNDALGSPIMALNQAGGVVWQESYQPYGQRQTKPAAANYDEQFYTGKQEEPDIGLQYFGARWYDPEAGRFTSIDPVGVQEGEIHSFNRYTYANNNPYRFTDPNGESPVDVLFLAIDVGSLAFHVAAGNSAGAASAAVDVAFSVVGLFSPIPGAGQALKAARIANKVSDVASSGRGVGAMARREYQAASYHGKVGNAVKSKAPTNAQEALDMSVQVKGTSPRRVGIDYETGEFAVFDQTSSGVFHGHVRNWQDLTSDMQNSLRNSGMVDRKGKILGGGQ